MSVGPNGRTEAGRYLNVPISAPPNSIKSKDIAQATPIKSEDTTEKDISAVVSGSVRRKSIFQRAIDSVRPRDLKGVSESVILDVIMPALRDLFFDAVTQTASRAILKQDATPSQLNSVRRFGNNVINPQPGYTPYHSTSQRGSNSYSYGSRMQPQMQQQTPMYTNRDRETNSFRDIVLETRADAVTALGSLQELINQYDSASVHDLLQIIGIQGSFPDMNYGWVDLTGAEIHRLTGGGYSLSLPPTVPLR